MANLNELVNKALANIYKGFEGVEPHLYELTSIVLNKALDDGLSLKYNIDNAAFIHELRTNVNVFSAFKAHNQCKDMAALLYDENGKIVPEAKWRKEALKISDHQNKTWLKTERNTTLRRARFASDFKKFDEKKHLYPNLRWLESTAGTPRTDHVRFYNMVRPVTDPIWTIHYPGDEWNCKCGIEQTKDAETDVPTELPEPTPGLDKNPYFSKEIFTETHPVFSSYINDGMNKKQISLAKKKFQNDLNEFKKQTRYKIEADFIFKNGSKIYVHDFCDSKNIDENLKAVFLVCDTFPKLNVKLPPHLINAGSNAEYIINDQIADFKKQTGLVVANNLKRAIIQKCDIVIVRLMDDYSESLETYIEKAKGELLELNKSEKTKHNIKQIYVIDKKEKVHLIEVGNEK